MAHFLDEKDEKRYQAGFFGSTIACCVGPSQDYLDRQFKEKEQPTLVFDQPYANEAPVFEPKASRPTTAISAPRPSWLGNAISRQSSLQSNRQSSLQSNRQSSRQSSISRRWTGTRQPLSRRPWTLQPKTRPSISIGAPTNFRRLTEPFDMREEEYRPLELSIFLPNGRLSPLPDFAILDFGEDSTVLEAPQPAVLRSTFGFSEASDDRQSAFQLRRDPSSSSSSDSVRRANSVAGQASVWDGDRQGSISALAPVNEEIASSYSADDYLITLPRRGSGSRSRPQTSNSVRLSRLNETTKSPRTSGSLRRAKTTEAVLDQAIHELNTIVEERRLAAMAQSGNTSPNIHSRTTTHVPAIAPSMKVGARSETLSDIGSAFSVPLTMKSRSTAPSVQYGSEYMDSDLNSPLSSRFSPPPAAFVKSSTRIRLTSWLRRSVQSKDSDPIPLSSDQFYHCTPAMDDAADDTSSTMTVSPVSPSTVTSFIFDDVDRLDSESTPTDTAYSETVGKSSWSSYRGTPEKEIELSRPSTSSISNRDQRQQERLRSRGLSIETAVSTNSVGTSILGVGAHQPPAYHELVPPMRQEIRVGVAF